MTRETAPVHFGCGFRLGIADGTPQTPPCIVLQIRSSEGDPTSYALSLDDAQDLIRRLEVECARLCRQGGGA